MDLFTPPDGTVWRVLVGMEASGIVRDAFIERGHDAWSCDLRESEVGGPHLQADVFDVIGDGWDIGIFHPSCTFLCSSGLHWNHRVPGRDAETEKALAVVRRIMAAPIPRIAIENPVGRIGTAIRPADQYIQPYEYGHDASKRTGLWLKGLPLLVPDPRLYVPPRMVNGRPRWANQTDSGQNKLGPKEDRWIERSRTYPGIARAMAEQWSPDARRPRV